MTSLLKAQSPQESLTDPVSKSLVRLLIQIHRHSYPGRFKDRFCLRTLELLGVHFWHVTFAGSGGAQSLSK